MLLLLAHTLEEGARGDTRSVAHLRHTNKKQQHQETEQQAATSHVPLPRAVRHIVHLHSHCSHLSTKQILDMRNTQKGQ